MFPRFRRNLSKVEPTTAENLEGGRCAFRVQNRRLRIPSGIFSLSLHSRYLHFAKNIISVSFSYQSEMSGKREFVQHNRGDCG